MSEQVSPKPTLTRLVFSSQRLVSSRTVLEREPGDLGDPFFALLPFSPPLNLIPPGSTPHPGLGLGLGRSWAAG